MTGIHIRVPVACFRKGLAREFFETEPLPPPSTCYGFLLSLVGEEDRRRHIGARVAPAILGSPPVSTILRTLWRIKEIPPTNAQPGANRRPDFQQLLTNIDLLVWLDSSGEEGDRTGLEERVRAALDPRARQAITRFGGLCLGESTHLVDEVNLIDANKGGEDIPKGDWRCFLLHELGSHSLPVWVDHVGTRGTRHETGNLEPIDPRFPPESVRMPMVCPPG